MAAVEVKAKQTLKHSTPKEIICDLRGFVSLTGVSKLPLEKFFIYRCICLTPVKIYSLDGSKRLNLQG